jgi:hypothetical protein
VAQSFGKPIIVGWQSIGSQVFEVRVKTAAGAAYDLTGMTVTVSGSIDGVYQLESLACTLSATPTDGTITFTPSSGEIGTVGEIECQLRIDNGGAIAFTFPFILNILAVQYSAGA